MPGFLGRSRAEQMALPEVRMELKLSFVSALAQYGCGYKHNSGSPSTLVHCFLHPPAQIHPSPPRSLCFPAAPYDAPEPGAGCTKPFSCPHPPLGYWKTRPSPGAPEGAGLGCDEDLGCRALQTVLCGWIMCEAAPALLQALPAWQVRGRVDACLGCRGAGSCGRGRASWSCNHGHGSEWIPLSGARERLGALGSLLQGRGRTGREADSRHNHG